MKKEIMIVTKTTKDGKGKNIKEGISIIENPNLWTSIEEALVKLLSLKNDNAYEKVFLLVQVQEDLERLQKDIKIINQEKKQDIPPLKKIDQALIETISQRYPEYKKKDWDNTYYTEISKPEGSVSS